MLRDVVRKTTPYSEDWAHYRIQSARTDAERRQALVDRFWAHHAQWSQNTTAEQRVLHREHEMATRCSLAETAKRWVESWWRAFWRWVRG